MIMNARKIKSKTKKGIQYDDGTVLRFARPDKVGIHREKGFEVATKDDFKYPKLEIPGCHWNEKYSAWMTFRGDLLVMIAKAKDIEKYKEAKNEEYRKRFAHFNSKKVKGQIINEGADKERSNNEIDADIIDSDPDTGGLEEVE